MPSKFNDKNGGLIAGYSDKWSNDKRPNTSMNAGSGSRASRNQGLGAQGVANTVPSDAVDTSKMDPADKIKYFRSLGLLSKEPEPAQVKFSPQVLVKELGDAFKGRPQFVQAITRELQGLPPLELKSTAEVAYNALQRIKTKTKEPKAIADYIIREIQKAKQ